MSDLTIEQKMSRLLERGFILTISPRHPAGVSVWIGSGPLNTAHSGEVESDVFRQSVSPLSFESAFNAAFDHAQQHGWLPDA